MAAEHNTDNQGNPIDENGKLIFESVESVDEITDEDFLRSTRNIVLPKIPQTVNDVIGAEDKPMVIKRNIFEKNKKNIEKYPLLKEEEY